MRFWPIVCGWGLALSSVGYAHGISYEQLRRIYSLEAQEACLVKLKSGSWLGECVHEKTEKSALVHVYVDESRVPEANKQKDLTPLKEAGLALLESDYNDLEKAFSSTQTLAGSRKNGQAEKHTVALQSPKKEDRKETSSTYPPLEEQGKEEENKLYHALPLQFVREGKSLYVRYTPDLRGLMVVGTEPGTKTDYFCFFYAKKFKPMP